MVTGICWIILGFSNLYLYKQNNNILQKTTMRCFFITGTIIFIIGFINLFIDSKLIRIINVLPILPAAIYLLYKMKQYEDAINIIDKLTKK